MPVAAASDVGSVFGKYFLMKKLAAGGMGEIFLAKQQGPAGFQKILVVKKILAHLTENKEFIEAFLGEARLAAQMNHRNVVQVFELGEENGAYFIAMEYVAGKSLRDVIDAAVKRKEKMPAELARQICEMICDGASYAHNLTDMMGRSLNLVHRDLNPQNVLISYTGDVKVIDFGIAKSEMSTVKTEAGMIKGKFVYMSPEQSLAKKLDKRSDIFAIGISLYEMLTGINPFHKNNIVLTLEAVQRYDPPPPSEYEPSYAPFDPIVAKALTKDRDRRYSDAAEMMDDLRRVVLPRPPERLGQFMQRLFRAQVEEEQKMLMDSDQLKLGAQKKTPAKHTPPRPAVSAQPEALDGGTQLLPGVGPRKAGAPSKPAPPPPARRAPPPSTPVRKQQGAGDTLIDMGGVAAAPAPAADDDVPGGTAMLKPGQAMPPPRRPSSMPTDTMPEVDPGEEAPEGATAFLGNSGRQPPARRQQPAPVSSGAATNIMTPEESAEAQRVALAKMEEAKRGVIRTRTRDDKRTELKQARSGRSMWLMLGAGLVVALLLLGGLLYFGLEDESSGGFRRRKPVVPVEQTQIAPVESAPAPEERHEAPPAEKPRTPPARKTPPGKLLGTLTLNPGPSVQVVFAGTSLPRQVGAYSQAVTAESGTIAVGDESTQFQVTLDYAVEDGAMHFKVRSTPQAEVAVNGHERGRTPLAELRVERTMTVLELKKPGSDNPMALRLLFKPN